jgi:hypothetical protein
MFDRRNGKPMDETASGTGEGKSTGDELFSRLERERALTINIMERIVDYGNLNKASQRVIQNDGSGGVDGMEKDEYKLWYGRNVKQLRESVT